MSDGGGGGAPGPADGDYAGFLASQTSTSIILIPCSIGWCLQILFAGFATALALPALTRKHSIPWAKPLLVAAITCNLVSTAVAVWDVTAYMVTQQRTTADLNNYKMPDIVAPIPAALTAACTQAFMALRCWTLIGRSRIFATVIVLGLTTTMVGAIWSTVADRLYMLGKIDGDEIFAPFQMWLWGNVPIDLVITAVLTWNLRSRRRDVHLSTRSQKMLDSLIRLAFETFALPGLVTVVTAIIYLSTWKDGLWWNLCSATVPLIPSVYVISFVYCIQATRLRSLQKRSSGAGEHKRQQQDKHKLAPFKNNNKVTEADFCGGDGLRRPANARGIPPTMATISDGQMKKKKNNNFFLLGTLRGKTMVCKKGEEYHQGEDAEDKEYASMAQIDLETGMSGISQILTRDLIQQGGESSPLEEDELIQSIASHRVPDAHSSDWVPPDIWASPILGTSFTGGDIVNDEDDDKGLQTPEQRRQRQQYRHQQIYRNQQRQEIQRRSDSRERQQRQKVLRVRDEGVARVVDRTAGYATWAERPKLYRRASS